MSQSATHAAVAGTQSDAQSDNDLRWKQVMGLPCDVAVEIAVPEFTVKNLMGLEIESVVETDWTTTANLPLKVNGELIGWCEFEVLGNRLAVRLTELAS
ncbi:MAG TPA: FliM/FliN family flagellar motor C-terminal domain-containing protein [Terriglobales bacterium]|nr:FliM/FliN family flagellar motor C-terminal domain-containing protein [Terriglobales bacterium]